MARLLRRCPRRGDADIAPDANGILWGTGLTLVNVTGALSTDQGESWCVNPISQLDTVVDRQWVETYKGEPFAFVTTGSIARSEIILSKVEALGLPDQGLKCPVVTKQVTMSTLGQSYQWPGEIAVDERNDLVYVGYNTSGGTQDNIIVARTDLNLDAVKQFKVTTTKGDSFDSFVAIDEDRAGNLYAVWTERRPKGKQTHSFISISRNKGQKWSKPRRLNKTPNTTTFPWVVAGSKGRVAVVYYGTPVKGPSPERVAAEGKQPPKWKVWSAYSTNALAKKPRWQETLVTTKQVHEGNICTSGTGCASGTRDLLDFFQVDLDPCGRMVITYTDNSRDTVVVGGQRQSNLPEYVYFVGQKAGPRFYAKPAGC